MTFDKYIKHSFCILFFENLLCVVFVLPLSSNSSCAPFISSQIHNLLSFDYYCYTHAGIHTHRHTYTFRNAAYSVHLQLLHVNVFTDSHLRLNNCQRTLPWRRLVFSFCRYSPGCATLKVPHPHRQANWYF